jgi:hypothetical protein
LISCDSIDSYTLESAVSSLFFLISFSLRRLRTSDVWALSLSYSDYRNYSTSRQHFFVFFMSQSYMSYNSRAFVIREAIVSSIRKYKNDYTNPYSYSVFIDGTIIRFPFFIFLSLHKSCLTNKKLNAYISKIKFAAIGRRRTVCLTKKKGHKRTKTLKVRKKEN